MSKESNSSSGLGVAGLLGVAFVVLKLTHVIDWSWWWVTCPFWGGVVIVIAIFLIIGIIWLIAEGASEIKRNRISKARIKELNKNK